MNQILITNEEKKAKSFEMKPVVKFFCIAAIIFAVVLICEGGINLYNNLNKNNDYAKPVLNVEKNGSSVNVTVNGEIGINKILYAWNGGQELTFNANGKKKVDFEIEIPQGTNKLNMSVIDVDGNTTKFDEQTISYVESEDTTKPVISIENSKGKLQITAMDETELDYFSYQWEGSDEVKITPSEEDKTIVEQELEVQKGTTRLTLTAVDKSGNIETTTKKIIGSNGPVISASLADNNIVVKVTDEFGITKIVYTHNGEEHIVEGIPEGAKEFEFKVPLKEGDNYLKINAYENGIMTEFKCKKTK